MAYVIMAYVVWLMSLLLMCMSLYLTVVGSPVVGGDSSAGEPVHLLDNWQDLAPHVSSPLSPYS